MGKSSENFSGTRDFPIESSTGEARAFGARVLWSKWKPAIPNQAATHQGRPGETCKASSVDRTIIGSSVYLSICLYSIRIILYWWLYYIEHDLSYLY